MVTIKQFKTLALQFPGAEESPHFEKISFRVKKKIFVTLNEKDAVAIVKLSEIDQSVYCAIDQSVIYPVPGKWGTHGWTMIRLAKVPTEILAEVVKKSYDEVLKGNKKV